MLRFLRKKNQLKQFDVAKYLGISNTYLSMIENGHRTVINDELKIKFCNLYGISQDELLYLLQNIKY